MMIALPEYSLTFGRTGKAGWRTGFLDFPAGWHDQVSQFSIAFFCIAFQAGKNGVPG
jgi:hypothetical protein